MLAVSLSLIVLALFLGDVLRTLAKRLLPHNLLKLMLLDVLVAFELCLGAFELGAILDHVGIEAWALGVFLFTVYQIIRWHDVSAPCPYIHVLDYMTGSKSLIEVIIRSTLILIAGLASFRAISIVWDYEMSSWHVGRSNRLLNCEFPWQNVPLIHGFCSEFLGTIVLSIGPKLLIDHPKLRSDYPLFVATMVGLMVLGTVSMALNFSGGMFNPMLASTLVGGCKGQHLWEHVLIYWIGATTGAIVASKFYPFVYRAVYGDAGMLKKKI